MNADLVQAAGFRANLKQGIIFKFFDDFIVSDGFFAFFGRNPRTRRPNFMFRGQWPSVRGSALDLNLIAFWLTKELCALRPRLHFLPGWIRAGSLQQRFYLSFFLCQSAGD